MQTILSIQVWIFDKMFAPRMGWSLGNSIYLNIDLKLVGNVFKIVLSMNQIDGDAESKSYVELHNAYPIEEPTESMDNEFCLTMANRRRFGQSEKKGK